MVKITGNLPSFGLSEHKINTEVPKYSKIDLAIKVLGYPKGDEVSFSHHSLKMPSVKVISPPLGLRMELMNFARRFLTWI